MIGFQRGINLSFSYYMRRTILCFLHSFSKIFYMTVSYCNHKELKNMFKKEIKGAPRIHLRLPNANVVLYGVFDTTVSKDALEKAVLFLSDKHKLLNCHIETDKENKVWYVIDKKLLPEVNTPKSKNINEILINELKHRFDFEKGPLIRFTLLNQTETTLIINCHHAICDGLSLMYLFKDITKILSGKNIQVEPKMPVFLEPQNIPRRLGNPRNGDVLSKAPELLTKTIIVEIVDSHGCNSQHRIGDKFYFDAAGNLLTERCPQRVCIYALQAITPQVFAANELFNAGIDPNEMRFKRAACFDVGLECGGWGRVVMEISVEDRKKT